MARVAKNTDGETLAGVVKKGVYLDPDSLSRITHIMDTVPRCGNLSAAIRWALMRADESLPKSPK